MAFMGILVLNAVLMAMIGMMGLGVVGLILLVVFLILWNGAKRREDKRQTLFLVLAVLGGLLALAGAATLVLFFLMLY